MINVKKDLNEIHKNGIKAKITTEEGRIHYMLYCLEQHIINEEINKVMFLYKYLNKSENKLSFEMSSLYSETLIKMEQLVGKKDDKGFWEYSIFQKIVVLNEEQNIKSGLKPENCMDLKKIGHYINPKLSYEEQLILNINNNQKLSKKDQIIHNLYVNKKNEELKKDLLHIEKEGIKANPGTIEGKIHYMMHLLNIFIKKNQVENIANIYLKLKDPIYLLNNNLQTKYADTLSKMETIINTTDLINLQFTKFYNQMPPLNHKGFKSFDDWQKLTIENIDNNISTIICAPTSAGKSIISGYVVTKGKSLYIVPTDALAWQVASYIGEILKTDIPILTLTYQSIPKRDNMIKLINNSNAVVGTPESVLDFLPFIKNDFKWVIFDEIHMMGKKECAAIEIIAKILSNIEFLGLSATIGNINELKSWFEIMTNKRVETIVCNKRFFNLQKYFYDDACRDFIILNPLSLVSIEEFESGTIVNKTLNPTPIDTWTLAMKLKEKKINLQNLDPYNYFESKELIELSKAYEYFHNLILFMVNNIKKYKNEIKDILNEFSNFNFDNHNIKIIDFIEDLKNKNMFPAIIFQQNTISCLDIVKKIAEQLDYVESLKFPNLRKDRIHKDKDVKKINKKLEKELTNLTEKQLDKKLKENKDFVFDYNISGALNAPHNDFIFNKDDKFSDNEIKEWAEKFKIYFPCINGDYHYLIRLLWRGIGVYVNGLPDNYLRLIQKLASKKQLAIVFSDFSLVFGISMPFRSSVIYKNNECVDNLDSMMYHQMAGRAGRRGLDKEGNVIFIGYSWNRIKELSASSIPNIEGYNRLIWTFEQAQNMSSNNKFMEINDNIFGKKLSDNHITNFRNTIINNNKNIWKFSIEKDKNLIQLMWMLRYSNEGIIISFLLPYLRKYFELCNANEENKQIEVAYFLSKFIDIYEPDTEENILPILNSSHIVYETIYDKLKEINIEIPTYIDGKIWLSIRNNLLVDLKDDKLRERLFNLSIKLKAIQHYCYHTKQINLTKLLGKLLTRIWWIYHMSSPIMNVKFDIME